MAAEPHSELKGLRIDPFELEGFQFLHFNDRFSGREPFLALWRSHTIKVIEAHVPFAELCDDDSARKSRLMREEFKRDPSFDRRKWLQDHKVARDAADPNLPVISFGLRETQQRGEPVGVFMVYNGAVERTQRALILRGMPSPGWFSEPTLENNERCYEVLAALLRAELAANIPVPVIFRDFRFPVWEDGRELWGGITKNTFIARAAQEQDIRIETDASRLITMTRA